MGGSVADPRFVFSFNLPLSTSPCGQGNAPIRAYPCKPPGWQVRTHSLGSVGSKSGGPKDPRTTVTVPQRAWGKRAYMCPCWVGPKKEAGSKRGAAPNTRR